MVGLPACSKSDEAKAPAAHTAPTDSRTLRIAFLEKRVRADPDDISAQNTLAEEKTIPAAELPFEFMLNALRLSDGFPVERFQARTGLPLASIISSLEKAEAKGLIERDLERVRPSERGRRFLNELLELFLR